ARQSRYLWLIPVIVLQFGYITALSFARTGVATGGWGTWPGLWAVHGAVFAVALIIIMVSLGRWARR
ncbi:MAG: hypothetical protein NWP49_07850, partial [Litorivicinaceae bacterium]|nr:hypothetical protein [Litorivicinaceae bacterium]